MRITAPSIGVDASLVKLGIADDGAIEVPGEARRAGWLDTTSVPGRQGPAVIAGHVDSRRGPAVFYRLDQLRPGDPVVVSHRDGSSTRFTVDAVHRYARDRFPTGRVYGPTPDAALRLITCGGDYLPARGGYQDNVVVYAS